MKHHTLLHRPQKQLPDQRTSTKTYSSMNSTSNKMESTKQFTTGHFSADNEIITVLLSTSLVTIRNSSGDAIKLRALLDSGSQASFVTEDVAKALMLPTQRSQINVSTMGSSHFQKTRGLLPVKLNDTIEVNLHLIPKISNTIPDKEIDVSTIRHVNNLNLADPIFNVPNKVDVLLGADVIEDIMLDNKIKDNGLCIRDSVFGWVVSGPVYSSGSNNVVSHMTTTPNCDSGQLLLKFWEIESVPEFRHLTLDERRCEEHFDSTTKGNEDRRFVVQMPFKDGPHILGLSKANAMKRFIRLEYILRHNVDLFSKVFSFHSRIH